jgi:hypothetical protein
MMNYQQLIEAKELAPLVNHSQSAADVTPAIVVQYVPSLGTGGAAATGKKTSDGLGFTVDGTTPAGLDRIGSSTGWITFATYDSLGEVLDAINGRAAWRAYLVAGLRSDTSGDILAQAAASCMGDNGLTFYFDTSAFDGCGVAISGEKFVNNGVSGHVTDADDECINYLNYAKVQLATSDGELQFYSASQLAQTQIGPTYTCGSGTAVEVNENQPNIPFLEASRGERLVIRCMADTAGNGTPTEFRVSGKTAVLTGARIVEEDNY